MPNRGAMCLGRFARWSERHPWLRAAGYGVGMVLLLLFWSWLDLVSGRSSVRPGDQIVFDLVLGVFVLVVMRYLDVAHAYALAHPWRGAGVAGLAILALFLVLGELPGPQPTSAAIPFVATGAGLLTFLIIGWQFSHGGGTDRHRSRDGNASGRPEDRP